MKIGGRYRSLREAFGEALVREGARRPHLVVLDADVQNSTFTELFAKKFPKRFLQAYIAEQNAVGMAVGLSLDGKLPVFATFSAFFTRAHDQLRMGQYAATPLVFVGTHAGVSVGEDGPSQMGLDDVAMFRAFFGSTVFAPCDAVSTAKLLTIVLKTKGVAYFRLPRNPLPVLYGPTSDFRIGGSHVLRKTAHDRVTVVGCGVTVHEALKVPKVRVIDCYSIKPIDARTLKRAARKTKRIIVVEDHVAEGGLADAVRAALGTDAGKVHSLAVRTIPKSGKPDQLLRFERIDAAAIGRAARTS